MDEQLDMYDEQEANLEREVAHRTLKIQVLQDTVRAQAGALGHVTRACTDACCAECGDGRRIVMVADAENGAPWLKHAQLSSHARP